MNIKQLINEEVHALLEASITRGFSKAVEALQGVQLDQQKLRKAFIGEKNPKKKEKIKLALIKMHKVVQNAELEFQRVLRDEPTGELEELDVRKAHGDKRIDNPATGNKVKLRTALKGAKGSKIYQAARKIFNNLKDGE
jgi:hypothetical protein|tara:strand:+ start:862 stop:1278 length:417 start_codon:yes stop_codon:yes gene_type:complete